MINNMKNLKSNLIRLMGEKNNFGVSVNNTENPYDINQESLNNILHYESYDPITKVFFNKKSQGFVLEASPLTGASDETTRILTNVLIDVLPEDADLQIMLWGSDKIGDILDSFEKQRSGKGEIFEWLAKKRTDYFKKGAHKSLIKEGIFLLRNFRLCISVSIPSTWEEDHTERLISLRQELVSSLQSIHIHTINLEINEFLSVINDILHPSSNVYPTRARWNKFESISNQLIDPEYSTEVYQDRMVVQNESENWEIRSLSVKDYAPRVVQWQMTEAIGQLFNTSLQIPCPFLISFSIKVINYEKSKASSTFNKISTDQSAKSQQASLIDNLFGKMKDVNFIKQRIADGDRLAHTLFQIHIFSPSEEARYAERKVRDLYQSNGWVIKKLRKLQHQSLLAALPMRMSEGMYSDLKTCGRLKTITAYNSANVAPLQGEWKGTHTPILLLPGRRGQIATFNPFDNQEGNYNVIIAAASGRGKSTFTQEYLNGLLGSGGRIWVIDIGRSYEKTCHLLGGTFIEFNPKLEICINPFTYIKNLDESLDLLKPLVGAMARQTTSISDEENNYLEKAIKFAWESKGNDATITTIAEWLNQEKNAICNNLGLLLSSYTASGRYARYFEGRSNIDLSNQFIVLELQELNTKKDLRRIVLMVLMFQINQVMFVGERTQPKTIILEEIWQYFQEQNNSMNDFIEALARTVRRFTGSLVTIGQSINDFFKNSASLAVFDNSDFKIVLGQTEEAIEQLAKSDRFTLNPHTERLFKSLRKTDEYSECIIKSPSGLTAHRIMLDDYSKILYSSKGKEFDAVNSLIARNYSLKESIQIVAENLNA